MSLTIQDIKTFKTTLSKASIGEDEIYFELDEAFRNLIESLIYPSSTKKVLKAQALMDYRTDLKKLEISDDLIDKLISSLEEYEKTGISEIKRLICEEYEISFPEEGTFSDSYYPIVMKYLRGEKGWETNDRFKYGLAELKKQYQNEKASSSQQSQNENAAQTLQTLKLQSDLDKILTIEQLEDIVKAMYKNLGNNYEVLSGFRYLIASFFQPNDVRNGEKKLTSEVLKNHRVNLEKEGANSSSIGNLIYSLESHSNGSEIKDLISKKYEISLTENVTMENKETLVLDLLADDMTGWSQDREYSDWGHLRKRYQEEQKTPKSEVKVSQRPQITEQPLQSEMAETDNSSNVNSSPLPESSGTELKLEINHLKEVVRKLNNAPKDIDEYFDVKVDLKLAFQSLYKSFFTNNNVPADEQPILSTAILKQNEKYLIEKLKIDQGSFDSLVQCLTRDKEGSELKNVISETYKISFCGSGDSYNVSVIVYLLCDIKMSDNRSIELRYEDLKEKYLADQLVNQHNKMFLTQTVPVNTLKTDELKEINLAETDSSSVADGVTVKTQETSELEEVSISNIANNSISFTSEPIEMIVAQDLENDNAENLETKKESQRLTIAGIVDFYKKLDVSKQRNHDIKMIYDAFKNLIYSFFDKDKTALLSANLIQDYKDDLLSVEISSETIEALENSLTSQSDGSEIQQLIFDEYKLIMPEQTYAFSYTTVVCGLLEGKKDYELGTFLEKLRPSPQEPIDQNPDILDLSGEIPASSSFIGRESQDKINSQLFVHNKDTSDNSAAFVSSEIPIEVSQNETNNPKTPREFLVDLQKNIMRYEHWSAQGFSFLGSKTPRYIKHLQSLLQNYDITGMGEDTAKSLTVNAVKELILAKDSDSLLRRSEARNTYNGYLVKGLSVLATTEENFRESHKISQPEEQFRVSLVSSRFF